MSFLGFEAMKRIKTERKHPGPPASRRAIPSQRVRPTRAHVSVRHSGGGRHQ